MRVMTDVGYKDVAGAPRLSCLSHWADRSADLLTTDRLAQQDMAVQREEDSKSKTANTS